MNFENDKKRLNKVMNKIDNRQIREWLDLNIFMIFFEGKD